MAKLYFYYSAMNAGKTTVLLQSAYNYQERGMETLIFKPAIDDRDQLNKVTSRIGLAADAHCFTNETNIYAQVESYQKTHPKLSCILVDEAQFLSKTQVLQLTDIVDQLNLPVLTYGLRSDFRGEPFEGSLYLLVYADNLIEIKTICHCGKKAIMTGRLDQTGKLLRTGEQTLIGGNETYVALCRKHFRGKG